MPPLLDQRVQFIPLHRPHTHLPLRDLVPQHRRALPQPHPPRQHRVFVYALRQRRRPYPLPMAHTRQRLRHHHPRLLHPIQKRAEAVAGVTPTRLTLPVLNRTVFAQMPICHDRIYRCIHDSKILATRIRTVAPATVNLLAVPRAPSPPPTGAGLAVSRCAGTRPATGTPPWRDTRDTAPACPAWAGGAFAAGRHWSGAGA